MAILSTTLASPTYGGRRYDAVVLLASLWLLVGLALDGWAHNNLLPDSFFTPWHGVVYSGYLACALAIGVPVALARRRGDAQLVAPGYDLALVGAALFGVGGALDLLWHLIFGVEANIEALLSPSHLVLFAGIVLMVSGPLRADWIRGETSQQLWSRLPFAFALGFLLLIGTFMTQFTGPFAGIIAGEASPFGSAGGFSVPALVLDRSLLGIYLYSAMVSGLLIMTIRRTRPPLGAFALALGFDALVMTVMTMRFLPLDMAFLALATGAGLLADFAIARLRPSASNQRAQHLIAALTPATFWGAYLTVVALAHGTWWTAPFLGGTVAISGAIGLLLSLLGSPSLSATSSMSPATRDQSLAA